jgi:formylglycine-generating enzyme required for sulfatase activity
MPDTFLSLNKKIIFSFMFMIVSAGMALWTFNKFGFGNDNAGFASQSTAAFALKEPLTPQMLPIPDNFIHVEGGTFLMGSSNGNSNESPAHEVTVNSFIIGKYPVTQKEWYEVMGSTVTQQRDMVNKLYPLRGVGDNYPMYYVNWYEALEYCNKRSLTEGLSPVYRISKNFAACDWRANGYRLPTEAEWEYAAKGGNMDSIVFDYSGGNSADEAVWYMKNSGDAAHPVGMKKPNSLGLYDMSGNVWEWCWDRFDKYPLDAQTNPRGAYEGSKRVIRGGCWLLPALRARSSFRCSGIPSLGNYNKGFRVARN